MATDEKPKGEYGEMTIAGNQAFGPALYWMKLGKLARRAGWNGKGMWVELQKPDLNSKMTLPYLFLNYPSGSEAYPIGARVPWLASQTDLLCNDWEIFELVFRPAEVTP